MEQVFVFKYINTQLNIGIVDLKNVYALEPELTRLIPEVYKGRLHFRKKGSSKRISYEKIKTGLVRKQFVVYEHMPF
jgi:hypothetical protein